MKTVNKIITKRNTFRKQNKMHKTIKRKPRIVLYILFSPEKNKALNFPFFLVLLLFSLSLFIYSSWWFSVCVELINGDVDNWNVLNLTGAFLLQNGQTALISLMSCICFENGIFEIKWFDLQM